MTNQYGAAKANSDIMLDDLLAHPIWLWCLTLDLPDEDDGPLEGDETWMRPLLSSADVTADMVQPLIHLTVKGTDLHASGLYDPDTGKLDAIVVYLPGGPTQPQWVQGLSSPVTYIAVPTIFGETGVEFSSGDTISDVATRNA
jgi:hypothetical protein